MRPMHLVRFTLLTVALIGGLWLLHPAARAQTKMARLNYKERTLPNGLKVLSVEDHASPTVAIEMWYHVGSKDDPEGRSGFAHLFEHLMFKSTKNMKSEMMDRLTEDVGGANNAFTADDVTVYYEVVPSNYLETLIWAEADRLSTLNVDDPNFKSERAVVEEEFRQRILAPSYGKFGYLIEKNSFTKHPYRRPGIGSIEELEAASLEDVRAFHATYYRPDNVTLVVAGDFNQQQFDAWVDKYFGRIPKPGTPLPRVQAVEPARTAERRFVEYGANVPLPAIGISYLAPPAASQDAVALRVAEAILSAGESSRLHHSLVYEQQIAQDAEASADLREDPGLFIFQVVLASGKKPEDVEKAILVELKKLQDQPASAAELEKAKNLLVTNQLRERETSQGKADALGNAAVLLGDPGRVNTDIERLQAVTAADVQRVMQKYFSDTNRVVLYYLPESSRPAQSGAGSLQTSGDANSRNTAPQTPDNNNAAVAGSTVGPASVQTITISQSNLSQAVKGKVVRASVQVKIIVNEEGKVISARAVSGPQKLRKVSEDAALAARFTPTLLDEKPVAAKGVITYNFAPGNK